MLMGLVFATSIVLLLRFIQPERLLRVESMPEVTDFFATLQSPITPMLPSFWAGEALFAGLRWPPAHVAALWSTYARVVMLSGHERWYFAGFSKSQKARRRDSQVAPGRVAYLAAVTVRRHLLIKDARVSAGRVVVAPAAAGVGDGMYNFRVLVWTVSRRQASSRTRVLNSSCEF
jgi:hypothetical protein